MEEIGSDARRAVLRGACGPDVSRAAYRLAVQLSGDRSGGYHQDLWRRLMSVLEEAVFAAHLPSRGEWERLAERARW